MSRFFSEKFASLVPYTPGEQPRDMQYVKLNTNESPFPPCSAAVKAAAEAAERLRLYPDPDARELTALLAKTLDVEPENIVVNNGSDETLYFAFQAWCDEKTPAAFADITYGFYPVFARQTGVPWEIVPLKDDFSLDIRDYFGLGKTIFIANPNAPTGRALTRTEVRQVLENNRENVVIVDEAYVDFGAESCVPLVKEYDNLLVVQTFSKSRSMAGARLGFGVGAKDLIRDLHTIRYSTNPYNVNAMTLAAGLGTLQCPEYTAENCRKIRENRAWTVQQLRDMGFTMTDSLANFIFVKHPALPGGELYRRLKEKGVLVRHFDKDKIRDYIRVTIGSMEQMEVFVEKVRDILEDAT